MITGYNVLRIAQNVWKVDQKTFHTVHDTLQEMKRLDNVLGFPYDDTPQETLQAILEMPIGSTLTTTE
jgi:hypothetical protein